MMLWGAVWGALLALLWPGQEPVSRVVVGVALGLAFAGSLRRVLRRELGWTAEARTAGGPGKQATADSRPEAPPPEAATAPMIIDRTAPAPSTPAAPARGLPAPLMQFVASIRAWLLGGNTIVRLGLLLLFVGLAFLANYAVEHQLLPPQLRLASIGAAGIALFATGWRMRASRALHPGYALTLQGGGIAVLYLTVFAAFRMYQFLPATAAFVLLALLCACAAVIAIAQNAQALAFIGFAGAYAAPLLVSTGQGQHMVLFGYYLLLALAILAIVWLRPWRALVLLGMLATFAVATAWGVLQYRSALYASVQPFLAAFFVAYLAATMSHALRHGLAARRAVDGTLTFGLPLLAFGLQVALVRDAKFGAAWSALAIGAMYLALGHWLVRRRGGQNRPARWLAECFAALGIGFVTLAVPLALDARWTTAVWAVEGAGVYWLGRRQGRGIARAAGLLLQVLAGIAYLDALQGGPHAARWPVANASMLGAAMLAGAALAIAWWSRPRERRGDAARLSARLRHLEDRLSPWLFWIGFLWLQFGLARETQRMVVSAQGGWEPVLSGPVQLHLKLLAWVLAAWGSALLARGGTARAWPVAETPAWTVLPVLLLGTLAGAFLQPHLYAQGGWAAWAALLVLHVDLLRRLEDRAPERWWRWVHAGTVWLLVLLAAHGLVAAVDAGRLWATAWSEIVLLAAGTAVLLALSRSALYDGRPMPWPFDRHARSYAWRGAFPLAAALVLGTLGVALGSNGDPRPLPFVPVFNPTDLALALTVGAVATWLLRLRQAAFELPGWIRDPRVWLVPAALGFVVINTAWLRAVHHLAGVRWDSGAMFDSFLVQAGYSILWTLLALGLMVLAFHRGQRAVWMAGAVLLAVTVLKLVVVDLANRGGAERIVVFIGVGLLMLVLGWMAPLPPARKGATPQPGAVLADGSSP